MGEWPFSAMEVAGLLFYFFLAVVIQYPLVWALSEGQGSALKINLLGLLNQAEAGRFCPPKGGNLPKKVKLSWCLKAACLAGALIPELRSFVLCTNVHI